MLKRPVGRFCYDVIMKPILMMMLGYPGSGKSYFARNLSEKYGFVRLNADGMRTSMYGSIEAGSAPEFKQALFGALDYSASQILLAGHSVVYDNQLRRRSDRQSKTTIAEEAGAEAVVVWVKTPSAIAIERATTRDNTSDQPRFTREEAELRLKTAEEAFEDFQDGEKVIEIDGTAEFKSQYEKLMDGLKKYGLVTE